MPPHTRTDLDGVHRGDPVATERIWARIQEVVRRTVRARAGAQLLRLLSYEDLVQEALAAVEVSLEGFSSRGEGTLDTWVAVVTQHRIQELARFHWAAKRGEGRLENATGSRLEAARGPRQATRLTPSRELIHREEICRLQEALALLSERERLAVEWLLRDRRPAAELAARLGVSERSVQRYARVGALWLHARLSQE